MEKLNLADVIGWAIDQSDYTYKDIVDNFEYLIQHDAEYIQNELDEKGCSVEWSEETQYQYFCDQYDRRGYDTEGEYRWALVIEKDKENGNITADIYTVCTDVDSRYSEYDIKHNDVEVAHVGKFESLAELHDYLVELLKE